MRFTQNCGNHLNSCPEPNHVNSDLNLAIEVSTYLELHAE